MSTSTPTPTFRLATTSDIPPLTDLINPAFRADTTTQVFLSPAHASTINVISAEVLTTLINLPDHTLLIAENPDTHTLLAHCSIRKLSATTAWLSFLAVEVTHQTRGLGRKMVAYAEGYARREWG